MEWDDLKDIGKKYGGSTTVVDGRCWNEEGTNMGYIEFNSSSGRSLTHDALKGHRINGHKIKLFMEWKKKLFFSCLNGSFKVNKEKEIDESACAVLKKVFIYF